MVAQELPLIVIPSRKYGNAVSSTSSGLITSGLKSCVAVLTFSPNLTTMAHLTNDFVNNPELMTEYGHWLREKSVGSVAAVIGGWPDRSDTLLKSVYSLLQNLKLPRSYSEINIPYYQTVGLKSDGKGWTEWLRRHETPAGPDFFPVGWQPVRHV